MLKVPDSGKNHGNAVFVAEVDGFLITDGTSGLNHGADTGFECNFDTVFKREECIGGHNSTIQVETKILRFLYGLLQGINPRRILVST